MKKFFDTYFSDMIAVVLCFVWLGIFLDIQLYGCHIFAISENNLAVRYLEMGLLGFGFVWGATRIIRNLRRRIV